MSTYDYFLKGFKELETKGRKQESQKEVAEKLKISAQHLNDILNNRKKASQNLQDKIAKHYGLKTGFDVADLGRENPKPLLSPKDPILYGKRTQWAQEIRPKWPSFDSSCENFFKVYRSDNASVIVSMEMMLQGLANQVAEGEHKKRKTPSKF